MTFVPSTPEEISGFLKASNTPHVFPVKTWVELLGWTTPNVTKEQTPKQKKRK